MRALRVVGLEPGGENVLLEDPHDGEQFSVPADPTLRAAANGDRPKLGQLHMEAEGALSPRDIQARIRAGATVEQVAANSDVALERVRRFAGPVLLERSRVASLASAAFPARSDHSQNLGQLVAARLTGLGHDPEAAHWDALRRDGVWIVQLRWKVGRSHNVAHWQFFPGAHGGTVTALDEHAAAIVEPEKAPLLRSVAPQKPAQPAHEAAAPKAPEAPALEHPPADNHPAGKKGRKPALPSWDEVLIGVRSGS
ncbi:MAG: septation protein SepH [Segniliparus sp.]|uniref:septation protein SepH n=1 Tax=Segniliparus sp. TaxID=2804064 RepID=UPI003F317980